MNNIESTLKGAKKAEWSYPRLFEALKQAGVSSYEVFLESYDAIYQGNFESWKEPAPEGFKPLIIAKVFNKEAVLKALKERQNNLTSFVTFLEDMAKAGVKHYQVDMAQAKVTYYGENDQDYYSEFVPPFQN